MMYAAVIKNYGDESSFEIDESIPIPEPKTNQVLVKIIASSVNPIDLMKRQGYGKSVFEKQRRINFPWVIGSDFSGHVVSVGSKVTRFKEGDEVWGCTSKATSGTYAEYASIDQDEINNKPKNLTKVRPNTMRQARHCFFRFGQKRIIEPKQITTCSF